MQSIILPEWHTSHLDGVTLRSEDSGLVASLNGQRESRLSLDELRTGLRVGTRSWVGVVRFSDLELRVVPKLAGGDIGLLRMVDFASGLNALGRHPSVHTFAAEGASLLDLIALLLAEACEGTVRSGLLADYVSCDDDLPVLRGRLRVREQILRRMGRVDRLECSYDEHTTDLKENQLLLAALSIAARRVSHTGVAQRLRRLQTLFDEACSIDDFDITSARGEITYNRRNGHYEEAHRLAWLVLDGLGIDDLYTGGGHRTFAFLLDMNRLFEDFVTRWVTCLLQGTAYRAMAQRGDRTILWNPDLNRPHSRLIPDLVIEHKDRPGCYLPIDAKYKLYNDRRLATSDIYQTFLYAFAYGHTHDGLPNSIILFPAEPSAVQAQRLHVRRSDERVGAQITALGLDIQAALREAERPEPGEIGKKLLNRIQSVLG